MRRLGGGEACAVCLSDGGLESYEEFMGLRGCCNWGFVIVGCEEGRDVRVLRTGALGDRACV
ncbi:hypothetical protein CHELA1G11_13134 [Hyphomicrobiales bacterium]|nr:hypothetical protein CHELA1G2_11174 [Hyphomicrobiales bacterium]CAH1669544.1 hypothetical protein CHELA1G11_13134 [Hyphomicrobiales bacterium]